MSEMPKLSIDPDSNFVSSSTSISLVFLDKSVSVIRVSLDSVTIPITPLFSTKFNSNCQKTEFENLE